MDKSQCNPLEFARPLKNKELKQHRYTDCKYYDYCLFKLVKPSWDSFTCSKCQNFIEYFEALSPEDQKPDPEVEDDDEAPRSKRVVNREKDKKSEPQKQAVIMTQEQIINILKKFNQT